MEDIHEPIKDNSALIFQMLFHFISFNCFVVLKYQIEFPTVTICNLGLSKINLMAGYFKLVLDFLSENGIRVATTPYEASVAWVNLL